MFREVSPDVDYPEVEEDILEFWKKENIFKKSIENRRDDEHFIFYEGPPTANGKPHPGHVLTRAMKDLIPRYKTMDGYCVERKGGWDTHGLPVELEVEKQLGISGKPEIEEYGVENFIKKCKESVFTYKSEWERMTERIGFWLDLEDPYITYEDEYIESIWWALKEIWEKGLLDQGYRVTPYCPRCGTSLSSHEVAQGYREVEDPSIFVRVPVQEMEDTCLLMWTTTPWTVPANVAMAVNADLKYALVEHEGERLILAEALVHRLLEGEYEVLDTFSGEEMAGWKYEPVFDFCVPEKPAHFIITADFVTLEEGTGIVHIAPAFGEDDMEVGKKHNLPVVQPVDEEGRFKSEIEPWVGTFVKDADSEIIEDLDNRGLLFRVGDYTHTYPFCWRCDTPLLYYAQSSWFIRMTELKDHLLANNEEINWYPEHIQHGRFGNFLENVVDWALSRERYWGTPLNIWICEACGREEAIGSKEELRERAQTEIGDIELHKPYVDDIIFDCPECEGTMSRVPEVIDCWFDSGSMPFAQWHYPFEEQEFNASFPADFICEAVDQTRGWFYSLLAISTLLFDRSPYKNVIVLGHILDEKGQKMSKSKGNVVDTWKIFNSQGADALRWYLYTANPPWNPSRFYAEAIDESRRQFLDTLWNVYTFYVLYARIDNTDPTQLEVPLSERSELDRWLLSRLNGVIEDVRGYLDDFEIRRAALTLEDFVDDLSNWYVRRSRRRFWRFEEDTDKQAAYLTLYEVLVSLIRLMAPFTPFISEAIYQNLVCSVDRDAPPSVHLNDFPEVNAERIDSELERAMETTRKVVNLGRSARNQANIKIRQPLSRLYVKVQSEAQKKELNRLDDLIKEELNVKELAFCDGKDDFVTYNVQPDYSVLGPKYGGQVKTIASKLKDTDPQEIRERIAEGRGVKLEVDSEEIILGPDELNITFESRDEYYIEEEGDFLAVLDGTMTEKLKMEGLAREMVNKIQFMRKEADFNIQDQILTCYYTDEKQVKKAVEKHADYIKRETLTSKLNFSADEGEYAEQWKLNGHEVHLSVARKG